MTIEELIILLNNRLAAFKQARDYARMSGNLEAMNAADKEVAGIQETLYKLKLLVPAAPESPLEMTEISSSIGAESLALYDITSYATDPLHEAKVGQILMAMGEMKTATDIDTYIQEKYPGSPVTGQMIVNAAVAEDVDARLMMAIMEQDSRFGTVGLAVSTTNPGNVGNDDAGNTRTYDSWQEGVNAVAEWLDRHRVTQGLLPGLFDLLASTTSATSTAATSTPVENATATTTGPLSTSTPATLPLADSSPDVSTTTLSTPEIAPPLSPAPEAVAPATASSTGSPVVELVSAVASELSSAMSTTTPTE